MFVKLYKTALIFFVSSLYMMFSGREVLYADNVENKQITKDASFEKKEQTKNTIVIDVNGKVRTGGIPEDISKIIETANKTVKKYGDKDDNAIVIINDNGKVIEQQKANEINIEKQEIDNSSSKKVIQKKHITIDKELSIDKNGKIKPLTVVDESGEFLIDFQKPANVKCDNVCNNFTDKAVADKQKKNTNTNKSFAKSKNNKAVITKKQENRQKSKQEKNNIISNDRNKKQNKFISTQEKAKKVVYQNKNKQEKQNIKTNTQQTESIEQIHCIGGCKKQKPQQIEEEKYNPSQYKILDSKNIIRNEEKKSGNDSQNIYIINNIVGIDEDMVITEDMIRKIEQNTKSKNKNVKQNTLFIKQNNGSKSSKNDTIKVANAEQRDKYLASLIENVSVADNIKFGEVAFVDSYDGI